MKKKTLFDPWPKNVQTYSWWKLGVLSTPYDLQKNIKDLCHWVGGKVPHSLTEMTPLHFFHKLLPYSK